jgi:hypothetical protein
MVDPVEIPSLPTAELQKNLSFTNPKGVQYRVLDRPQNMVDYRIHFALYLKSEVKTADFSGLEFALKKYWIKAGTVNEELLVFESEFALNSDRKGMGVCMKKAFDSPAEFQIWLFTCRVHKCNCCGIIPGEICEQIWVCTL